MAFLILVLIVAAVVLAAVALIETRGRGLLAWGLLCLAVALLLGHFHP